MEKNYLDMIKCFIYKIFEYIKPDLNYTEYIRKYGEYPTEELILAALEKSQEILNFKYIRKLW